MSARAAPALRDGIITLKDQWRLALAAVFDSRLSRLDLAVLIVVVDRFYKAKGNSRASSRYLAKALSSRRQNILNSLRKLLALDYLEETRKGCGTRATEYRPSFELASGPVGETTTGVDASGPVGETTTYLPSRLTKTGVLVSRTSAEEGTRGAASPPPPCAPVGAGAVSPRDPVGSFEELWTAYAFKQDRQKAKAAYQKLNPDGTLNAQMVAAASGWASAYEDNGTEPKWRMRLHNWISGENWLADPPLAYESPKVAAIANGRGSKAKAKLPAADHRKPDSRTAPRKVRAKPNCKPYTDVRPVKPGKALNWSQRLLGQEVASGALGWSRDPQRRQVESA